MEFVTPYYEQDGIVIYHGDCLLCREWLRADVMLTDPPYGTQFSVENPGGGYGRRQNAGDSASGFTIANDATTETRDAALQLWGERPVAMFGSPRMPDPPGAWADRLVWDKKRPGMNGGPWRYRHETVFVSGGFVRVNDSAVSVLEAWPDQSLHIHAKPVSLMLFLVAASPVGMIADPFMGSGTTLVAAKRLGRKAIGIELEEKYCEIAAKRLQQGALPLEMGA